MLHTPPRLLRLLITLCVLCMLAGCYSPLQQRVTEHQLLASGKHDLITGVVVPSVRGQAGCGAQALATAIAFCDNSVDPVLLADELPWHDHGATPPDIILAARERGYTATILRGNWEALASLVQRGQLPIVMVDASARLNTIFMHTRFPEVLHWVTVSGIAKDGSELLLAAPDSQHHPVQRDEFLPRWAKTDYCLILIERP